MNDPTKADLKEINPGLWLRPEQVTAVVAFGEHKLGASKIPPQVKLYLHGKEVGIGWEFETWEEAKAMAAKIATSVNKA